MRTSDVGIAKYLPRLTRLHNIQYQNESNERFHPLGIIERLIVLVPYVRMLVNQVVGSGRTW